MREINTIKGTCQEEQSVESKEIILNQNIKKHNKCFIL